MITASPSSLLAWDQIPPIDIIKANYNKRVQTVDWMERDLEYPAPMIEEAVPFIPTGHLLNKATLPRMNDVAALPNT